MPTCRHLRAGAFHNTANKECSAHASLTQFCQTAVNQLGIVINGARPEAPTVTAAIRISDFNAEKDFKFFSVLVSSPGGPV